MGLHVELLGDEIVVTRPGSDFMTAYRKKPDSPTLKLTRSWVDPHTTSPTINGNPIGDIKKGFAAACDRVGIQDATPHTLRHTAATWLMQSGVKTWEAAGFLAMSEKMLIDVYGHHHPDYMRAAAEAIGRKPFRRISA